MYEGLPVAAIAAVADNGIIGLNGKLPWRLPKDLRRFKRLTRGHAVIMGRRTWQELGRPLPHRLNVVLSATWVSEVDHGPAMVMARSLGEAWALSAAWELQETRAGRVTAPEIFVIGGAVLWLAAWPNVDRLYLTRVHANVKGDTRWPELNLDAFEETANEAVEDRLPSSFVTLQRRTVQRTA